MTAGQPRARRHRPTSSRRRPTRARPTACRPAQAHRHHRLRTVVVRPPLRPRRTEADGPRRAATAAGRRARPRVRGGDLCIQACSNDPLVAFHAVRNLARPGHGHRGAPVVAARLRSHVVDHQPAGSPPATSWASRTAPATSVRRRRPRWTATSGWATSPTSRGCGAAASWSPGASACSIEVWDRNLLADQEATFGRTKLKGAPLTGARRERRPRPRGAGCRRSAGHPGRRARPARQPRAQRRRPDPAARLLLHRRHRPRDRLLLGGLFFLAYKKDPQQFVTLQRSLGRADALNEYIRHIGSAVFACPPGTTATSSWRDHLFS